MTDSPIPVSVLDKIFSLATKDIKKPFDGVQCIFLRDEVVSSNIYYLKDMSGEWVHSQDFTGTTCLTEQTKNHGELEFLRDMSLEQADKNWTKLQIIYNKNGDILSSECYYHEFSIINDDHEFEPKII